MVFTLNKPGHIAEYFVFMWADRTEGEGMFTSYTFQAGHPYDVRLIFSSLCTQAGGHVYVYAMNGLTEHTNFNGCGNGYPDPSSV